MAEQSPMLLSTRPLRGKSMADLVHRREMSPQQIAHDPDESQRNYQIAANMRKMAHIVNTTIMRVVLPNDGHGSDQWKKAQAARQAEWYHQASMPYYSNFMHTPTDAQRLNNPSQAAAFNQRQLSIPSSYGQFFAFMHALSAAFGQLS